MYNIQINWEALTACPPSNQNNQDDKSKTNPKRRQNPNPRPRDDFAQFKDNKGNSQKPTESDAAASIIFIFFHFSFLSGFRDFPFPFVLTIGL
jgi:hypothetical protein